MKTIILKKEDLEVFVEEQQKNCVLVYQRGSEQQKFPLGETFYNRGLLVWGKTGRVSVLFVVRKDKPPYEARKMLKYVVLDDKRIIMQKCSIDHWVLVDLTSNAQDINLGILFSFVNGKWTFMFTEDNLHYRFAVLKENRIDFFKCSGWYWKDNDSIGLKTLKGETSLLVRR